MSDLQTPLVRFDLMRFDGSRDRDTNALLYPGVFRRQWLRVPGTGVWFCLAMEPHR